jgi:hypothetical protein
VESKSGTSWQLLDNLLKPRFRKRMGKCPIFSKIFSIQYLLDRFSIFNPRSPIRICHNCSK